MSRLTILHINIIGAVVCVIVGVALYFTIITAGFEDVNKAQAALKAVQDREAKFATAQKALETATKNRDLAIADYRMFEAEYMPVIGYPPLGKPTGDERLTLMMRLFWPNNGRSWPERFIKRVRSHMAAEQRANGIVWENPGVLALPAFGPDPNTIEAAQPGEGLGPVLHYRYQMSVRARSLDALMRHVRDWTSARGMGVPTVEGLEITGNSPNLRASYMLTLTIILRDEEFKRIPPTNPRISGSGGGAGGGGGMMGMMGMGGPGMMGMRPGGMGGMSMPMGMMGSGGGGGGMAPPPGLGPAAGSGGGAGPMP
jgi:hypothetical protein